MTAHDSNPDYVTSHVQQTTNQVRNWRSAARARRVTAMIGIAFAPVMAACGGDSTTGVDDGAAGEFTAMIDGNPWSASIITTAFYGDDVASSNGLTLLGSNGDEWISFELREMRTGEHVVGETVDFFYGTRSAFYDWVTSAGEGFVLGSGRLVLTELSDSRIRGTFEFVAAHYDGDPATEDEEVTVRSGEFSVDPHQ